MKVKDVVVDMHQGINTVADKVEYLEKGIPIIQSKTSRKVFWIGFIRLLQMLTDMWLKMAMTPQQGTHLRRSRVN